MATATAGSRQSQQREEENELSLPLLGGADGSQHINKNEEIIDADNSDEAKTKLLESSTSASAQVHQHVQEHCDGDESLTKKQLNEGNSTPIERQSQQIPTEDESAAVARAGAESTTINIDAELKGEGDCLLNNRNSSRSAPATREGDKSDAAQTANGSKDQGSESDCCSFCVLPKCLSEWLGRHKDTLKWVKLWASFLILRLGLFVLDLVLDINLIVKYGLALNPGNYSAKIDENRNASGDGTYGSAWSNESENRSGGDGIPSNYTVESVENRSGGDVWYFWLTLGFVLVPAFIIAYLNGKFYLEKRKTQRWIKENEDKKGKEWVKKLKDQLVMDDEWKFHLRALFCLFLISPLAR